MSSTLHFCHVFFVTDLIMFAGQNPKRCDRASLLCRALPHTVGSPCLRGVGQRVGDTTWCDMIRHGIPMRPPPPLWMCKCREPGKRVEKRHLPRLISRKACWSVGSKGKAPRQNPGDCFFLAQSWLNKAGPTFADSSGCSCCYHSRPTIWNRGQSILRTAAFMEQYERPEATCPSYHANPSRGDYNSWCRSEMASFLKWCPVNTSFSQSGCKTAVMSRLEPTLASTIQEPHTDAQMMRLGLDRMLGA